MADVQQVDLVVIGLGPGGEALATATAKAGLKVVAVDRRLVGGECPYFGCVPTKMMVRASDLVAEAGRAAELSGEVTIRSSWAPVAERVAVQATDHWDDRVAVERLEKAGATVLHGVGRLSGVRRVTVAPNDGTEPVTFEAAKGVVLNPGTRPATPPVEGLADTPYWTNRDAVQATEVPASLVVVGGGPIGCELAQVFSRFGVQVTVIQHGDRILPANEPEAAALLTDVFAHEGIRVVTGSDLTKASYADGRFDLTLDNGEQLTADKVLVAAGRLPNHDDVGLETVGLDPAARSVPVDDRMRAGDGLWVIGDATGHGAFTHMSMYQNAIARRDILGEEGAPAAYHAVPHVTFTDPEVAGVGMTEQQARDAGLTVRVGTTKLEESTRGFTHGPGSRGLIKVVEDADRGVLVGATVVGPSGGEIIGFFVVAVHAGVPVATLRSMIYAYPTFHRAIESALSDLSDLSERPV
jgi:pyruvate/2-oxoglutarate dehydrogenase complex dihydrolipoamide dehydrogenase (E3) component